MWLDSNEIHDDCILNYSNRAITKFVELFCYDTTYSVFIDNVTQAVLLFDASNASNSINHHPSLAAILINIEVILLFSLMARTCFYQKVLTTQGHPIAMVMYMPLMWLPWLMKFMIAIYYRDI